MWLAMFLHGMFTGGLGALWHSRRDAASLIAFLFFFGGTIMTLFFGSPASFISNLVGIILGWIALKKSDYA